MKGYHQIMTEAKGTTAVGGTSMEKKAALQVKELGLTQVDGQPKDHDDFIADVIFVHGLQGHPKRTWQSKSPTETHKGPRKHSKLFSSSFLKKDDDEDNGLFWPAELLPGDFENVRILTYGYDSKVTKYFKGPPSKSGIFQSGGSFLRAVSRVRAHCSDRPIIFVAHSLGYVHFEICSRSNSTIMHVQVLCSRTTACRLDWPCAWRYANKSFGRGLIVKQALIEARKQASDPALQNIYNTTYAVIFFGTPHRGSDLTSWGRLLSSIAQAIQMDTNEAILIDLDPESGSSKLEELRLDFDDILNDKQRAKELRVFSFQEAMGMTSVKLLGNKVSLSYNVR